MNYEIPINKIPLLSFIKANYSYTGDYNWQRASVALSEYTAADGTIYNLGNTIQNAMSHNLNATLSMDTFYKYIGLTQKTQLKPNPKAVAPKPGEKVANANALVPKQNNFYNGLIGILTSVKNIQANYTKNSGTRFARIYARNWILRLFKTNTWIYFWKPR